MMKILKTNLTITLIFFAVLAVSAQTTEFSYQGKLTDTGTPSANYDFEFRLFNVATGGAALGIQQKLAVPVTNNVFSVTLDFGASVFDGSNRWLEIAVKRPAEVTYTMLNPRHQISSVPYSIKTKTADLATNANQLGGVNASEYVTTSTVGGSFIKNDTAQQTANFNITGNGLVGGNIGIGTTSPSARLTIVGSGVFNAPTAARFDIYNSAFGGGYLQHVLDSGTWQFATTGGLTRMVVDSSGRIGIGTATPNTRLTIGGGVPWTSNSWTASMNLQNGTALGWEANPSGQRFGIGQTGGGLFFFRTASTFGTATSPANYDMIINDTGYVGIGTITPATKLSVLSNFYGISHTDGSVSLSTFLNTQGGWFGTRSNHSLHFYTNDGSPQLTVTTSGNVGIGTTAPTQKLSVAGTTKTNILQITGGSDLAENFEVADKEIKPGMVVAIDPNNSGKLILASGAYNRKVVGIVSGANNLSAGMLLPDLNENANSMPVALSGRVWVYADASRNPIKPGDLLTTSDTPGYAMKVKDYKKAQGAVIGKAMTELKSGKGLVLVLVSLQ